MLTVSRTGEVRSIPKDAEALHVPASPGTAGSGAVSVAGGTAALWGGFRSGSTAEWPPRQAGRLSGAKQSKSDPAFQADAQPVPARLAWLLCFEF